MKIKLSISKRTDLHGRSEILLLLRRRFDGKVIDIRAKSGVFINPKMFDANKNCIKSFAANKLITEEVKYHNEQLKCINNLLVTINNAYNKEVNKNNICGKWLENIVKGRNTDKTDNNNKDVYKLFDCFLEEKTRAKSTIYCFRACISILKRYELYVRITNRKQKNFLFDVNTVTRNDIKDLKKYITEEKELSEMHPDIFKKIFSQLNQPPQKINKRADNTVIATMEKLKSFFLWLNREGITSNRPFDGFDIGAGKYGTPYYLTIKERDLISSTPMPTKNLEIQRDIFIFQCFVGCRISDLRRFTRANITDNMLVYTPQKTKKKGTQALQARVPLHTKAIELIRKYNGLNKHGQLFPVTTTYSYNNAIKRVFTIAGITRMVEVRNAHTGEIENRPLNEIASSHLARRTFVGNLYLKVADPNLIGKMSGHVEGSQSFARYRKIEDNMLKDIIDTL